MTTSKQEAALTKARVLCSVQIGGKSYEPNAVVELTESDLYLYRKSIDAHPDSVAYAEKLGRRAKARRQMQMELEADLD